MFVRKPIWKYYKNGFGLAPNKGTTVYFEAKGSSACLETKTEGGRKGKNFMNEK